jgi:hypothetical protein
MWLINVVKVLKIVVIAMDENIGNTPSLGMMQAFMQFMALIAANAHQPPPPQPVRTIDLTNSTPPQSQFPRRVSQESASSSGRQLAHDEVMRQIRGTVGSVAGGVGEGNPHSYPIFHPQASARRKRTQVVPADVVGAVTQPAKSSKR